ncbi:hypothetical protein ELQ35_05430 [Peribacillus cavernae]|uniref:Uncharacterized protein n=1 Tax=Peribacillus cavernae TaxID=1674310 RepID=A0A3S0U653_9BACI|nr:hypothetical protein [Peribacillus cavernae]MDQ0218822.1 hypothetical protein [Peribacillus cavernae]RUQ31027.1 hypothetical protein ELQ35_05430 [Peribacillus cavernae]
MNRSIFPAFSAIVINGIVLASLFLTILVLNGFSKPGLTQAQTELPSGQISTVLKTQSLQAADHDWTKKDGERLVQKILDITVFAGKHEMLRFKKGTKARFYLKEKGHELNGQPAELFLIQNGKKDKINHEKGAFLFPDKEGTFIFEANFESEQGSIQYVTELEIY